MNNHYFNDLAMALKRALLSHVFKTPEKESIVIDVDSDCRKATFWIEGRYKVEITDMYNKIGRSNVNVTE